MKNCLFCNLQKIQAQLLFSNKYFNVILDGMPVSPGHIIIIPKKHILSILDLPQQEYTALKTTIAQAHRLISSINWKEKYEQVLNSSDNEISKLFITNVLQSKFINNKITDFNLGINDGGNAGRTINHLHIHIIPRFSNDVDDPIGGVRNVIPGMGNYHKVQFPITNKILSFAQKGIILNKKKTKILVSKYLSSKYLAKKLNNKKCLPGGQLEWGENPDESFIREIKEETGVDIKPGDPIMIKTWKYTKDNSLKQIVAVSRIGYYESGSIQLPKGEQETTMEKAKWIDVKKINPDEFVIDEQPVIKKFLKLYRKHH